MNLTEKLREFAKRNKMKGKGPLCVALVVTRHAKKLGLPLKPDELLTDAGGQVMGLGKSAVQAILNEHGIDRVLAEEGGRTSRGSVGNMRKYAAFLNELRSQGVVDLDAVEKWWIERVKEYFAEKPFVLRFDASKSLRAVIRDLLEQAERRQAQSPGATFVGTMLQHLVGAKLNLLLDTAIEHHGASVADEASGREGDFIVEDVAIHVTTSPSEALLRKCKRNLDNGLKPVIITTHRGSMVAEGLADQAGFGERLDIFEAEQFLAGNLYELGKFALVGRRTTAEQLVEAYNQIIDECETDPSLRIDVSR
jgi:predicted RNA-binding protein with RPS1 domain